MPETTPAPTRTETLEAFARLLQGEGRHLLDCVANPNMNEDTALEIILGTLGEQIARLAEFTDTPTLRHLLRWTGEAHDWNRSLDPLRYVRPDLADDRDLTLGA